MKLSKLFIFIKKGSIMKIIKKSSIIIGLLLGFVSNGYTMDAPEINYAAETRNLPGELQGMIILKVIEEFEITGANEDLQKAAEQIKRLAFQNAELTKKINEPGFCLEVIKKLAKKFNRSDAFAARALGTKEAVRRVGIQQAFASLCEKYNVSENELEELYNKGIDMQFTTRYDHGSESFRAMPIYYALIAGNVSAVKFLLDKGSDINNVDGANTTALGAAIRFAPLSNRVAIVKMFLERGLSIHKDGNKYSALEYAISTFKKNEDEDIKEITRRFALHRNFRETAQIMDKMKEIIKLLLEAGADPEDKIVQGNLPYIKDKEVIDMIKDAVDKKYGRK